MRQKAFFEYTFIEKNNRRALLIAGIGTIMQFLLFKYLYPFPDFSTDSHKYITAVVDQVTANSISTGYTKFLLTFHSITHSDIALIAFQYFFIEFSCLYIYFTILYFYSPTRTNKYILFSFLFLNPLFLYLSNHLNSDPLFISLSVLWISELLWIINKPAPYQILTQAILLVLCLFVQKTAAYYPILAIIAFTLSRQPIKTKLAGIALSLALVTLMIVSSVTRTFTPDGWQVANIALYIRRHITVDSMQLPSKEARQLDRISQQFFAQTSMDFDPYATDYGANFFIVDLHSPLAQYFSTYYSSDKEDKEDLAARQEASVPFNEYGAWIIKKNPIAFLRHFILPNAINYFLPPLEELLTYNRGVEETGYLEQDWFDYKLPDLTCISGTIQGYILSPFPYIYLFLNILAFGSAIWFFILGKFSVADRKKLFFFYLLGALLIANFCFNVFASVSMMRTQVFPMIVTLIFSLLTGELLFKQKSTSLALKNVSSKIDANPEIIIHQTN